MSMSLISGISNVQIDGVVYPVGDDVVKFEMATINREPIVSKNGSIFMKETPIPAKLSFSILVPGTVDVSTFNSLTSSNVVVHLANGSILNANSFATSGNNEYDSAEGKFNLEFFGPSINVSLGN
jgi:hypothetical protein